jgi:flagellar basal-body rod modification protein FlgD
MQYQDPLEPTSNTEYIAQLATFSQLEATLSMQNSLESSNANALVGQYVIVKSTSSVTGETTAVAGFVDYIQYENSTPYVSINGSLYKASDVYEVADVDYMEAVTLADSFASAVSSLPSVNKLTVAWQDDVENLTSVYNSLTSYQKAYIDSDTLTTFNNLVAKMKELVAAAESTASTATGTTATDSMTGSTDTTGSTGTENAGSSTDSTDTADSTASTDTVEETTESNS